MATRELTPLTTVEEWALPILVHSCRDYARNDAHLIRFGILLWNWKPDGLHQQDEHVWEFERYHFDEDDYGY